MSTPNFTALVLKIREETIIEERVSLRLVNRYHVHKYTHAEAEAILLSAFVQQHAAQQQQIAALETLVAKLSSALDSACIYMGGECEADMFDKLRAEVQAAREATPSTIRDRIAELEKQLALEIEARNGWWDNCKKAEARVAELEAELESHAWGISPAMAQAKIDQLGKERDELNKRIAELEADNDDLRRKMAAIYTALGTQEADCDQWPAQITDLRAENTRLIEDRARFPDRPDDIGRMIGAHFENLKGVARDNEEAWRWACTRETIALRQRDELIALLAEIRDRRPSMKRQADKIDAALAKYSPNGSHEPCPTKTKE